MSEVATRRSETGTEVADLLSAEAERIEVALLNLRGELLTGFPAPLATAVDYALASRGKRLRPILCCAAFRALSGAELPDAVRRLACALELIHTYSLVHDDLPCMDDDDLRRGRPTLHRVHGTSRAIFAGAALIPLSMTLLAREAGALGLNGKERAALVVELCGAAGAEGMIGGQLLDLDAEEESPGPERLERIHRAKTGALLASALRLGARAAGAGEIELAALTAYGQNVGLAFQIADDILDVTGDSATIGKTAGRDQSLGKATYPAFYGLDGARRLAHERVDAAIDALRSAAIAVPELEALARYVVQRSS